MKYAFFPGCSLESTGWDFDRSTRAVCRALGIELVDIPEWVCCGSTPAHTTSASLSVALPVMNLQKAQSMGLPVLTACASCYSRLRTANHTVLNDPEERGCAERVTGKPYDGSVEVRIPIFRVEVWAGHVQTHRALKALVCGLVRVVFQGDPSVDGAAVEMVEFVEFVEDVILNGFCQGYVVRRQNQFHGNKMQTVCGKIQSRYFFPRGS